MVGSTTISLVLAIGMGAMQSVTIDSPYSLEQALRKPIDGASRAAILKYLDPNQLEKGIWPRYGGRKVAFAIRSKEGQKVILRLSAIDQKDREIAMTPVGDDVYATVVEFAYGDAYVASYVAGGKTFGDRRNVEVYQTPDEMKSDTSVPRGRLLPMPKQESKIYPGTTSEWWVYVPAKPAPPEGYALMVFQDGQWAKNYSVPCLDNMIDKGDLPPTVAVFIKPSEHSDGRSIRWRQYDVLSNEYVRFVLDEYMPVVEKNVPGKITDDPARRCIAGLSSGGICAFTAAWERPDKFGLVLSWIGSYTNIASGDSKKDGGHNYPALIRKTDKKPIRVFLQDGKQDLDNEHGNWWIANLNMVASLKYKGYDYKWVPGNGFHSDAQGRATMPDAIRWLFQTGSYAPK